MAERIPDESLDDKQKAILAHVRQEHPHAYMFKIKGEIHVLTIEHADTVDGMPVPASAFEAAALEIAKGVEEYSPKFKSETG